MITRPIVIIDGVVQDSVDAHVSIADAAFSIGEGILETIWPLTGRSSGRHGTALAPSAGCSSWESMVSTGARPRAR